MAGFDLTGTITKGNKSERFKKQDMLFFTRVHHHTQLQKVCIMKSNNGGRVMFLVLESTRIFHREG